MLLKKPEYRNTLWGTIIALIGLIILLNNLDIIDFGANLIWPLLIIIVGISILRHGSIGMRKSSQSADHINVTAILGGGDYSYTSKSLSGGSVFSLMGGAKLDFRQADFSGDSIVLDVMIIMGGLEVIVPERWQAVLQGTPILGGMDDKTSYKPQTGEGSLAAKRFIIKGTAIMGGVDIKN